MQLVFKPSTIHCGSAMSRRLNIKKSIQYPLRALYKIPYSTRGGAETLLLLPERQ